MSDQKEPTIVDLEARANELTELACSALDLSLSAFYDEQVYDIETQVTHNGPDPEDETRMLLETRTTYRMGVEPTESDGEETADAIVNESVNQHQRRQLRQLRHTTLLKEVLANK